jgi:hypothetical protein
LLQGGMIWHGETGILIVTKSTTLVFTANPTIRSAPIETNYCSPTTHAMWHIAFPDRFEIQNP